MRRLLFLMLMVWMITACGAPLKTANAVRAIFSDSQQLNEKVSALCQQLNQRQQQPNLAGITLANDVCSKAGTNAQDYGSLTNTLGFSVVQAETAPTVANATGGIFTVRTVSEVWLNRTLLELAKVVFNDLKNETDGLLSSANGNGSSKNNDFKFQVIGKPVFDSVNFTLSLEFNLSSTKEQNGNVDLNNHFKVSGVLIDKKYFAATAQVAEVQTVEKSLLRDGKILILIVPHAGDVFVDITTDLNFYSFGVDSAMKKKIIDALGPGLKSIPDLIAGLQAKQ